MARRNEESGVAVSLLEQILASKHAEIAAQRARTSPSRSERENVDPIAALARRAGQPLHLVAEVKFKSPSAGELSKRLDAGARTIAYARAGAAMVSVLCDASFFGGGFSDLRAARASLDAAKLRLPLLAKEFVLDEVQLDLAAEHGADAVLLIARIVSPAVLAKLATAARARGLEPLIEVLDDNELAVAVACDARLIGVNARDLDTLAIDTDRAARILAAIPKGHTAIHLSGIKSAESVGLVARGRADAALLGEALMRKDDPEPLLRELVAAATP